MQQEKLITIFSRQTALQAHFSSTSHNYICWLTRSILEELYCCIPQAKSSPPCSEAPCPHSYCSMESHCYKQCNHRTSQQCQYSWWPYVSLKQISRRLKAHQAQFTMSSQFIPQQVSCSSYSQASLANCLKRFSETTCGQANLASFVRYTLDKP